MNILVIGKSGQMAQALANTPRATGEHLVSTGRPHADLADPDTLSDSFDLYKPDIVINAAAYTAVDKAESEPEQARIMNVDGPRHLAELCLKHEIPLIHLSTDCAFDGALDRPYVPGDAVSPIGVYGNTKVDGEHAVRDTLPAHLIIRVSWIFSHLANNFVKTMLSLAEAREEVTVVDDQFGCPTHAPALAEALIAIARQAVHADFDAFGTYHLAGTGSTNRASLAKAVFAASALRGGPKASVQAVPTSAYPTAAKRPLNARLNSDAVSDVFGVSLPKWQDGLSDTLDVLVGRQAVN